jgi:hypothetical protein
MDTLEDIAPLAAGVAIRDKTIGVRGVAIADFLNIVLRFPAVGDLLTSGKLDAASLVLSSPNAIAPFIAAGCGKPLDPKYEALAAALSADEQLDLLIAIFKFTMPGGAVPFVQKLIDFASIMSGKPLPPLSELLAKLKTMGAASLATSPSASTS